MSFNWSNCSYLNNWNSQVNERSKNYKREGYFSSSKLRSNRSIGKRVGEIVVALIDAVAQDKQRKTHGKIFKREQNQQSLHFPTNFGKVQLCGIPAWRRDIQLTFLDTFRYCFTYNQKLKLLESQSFKYSINMLACTHIRIWSPNAYSSSTIHRIWWILIKFR